MRFLSLLAFATLGTEPELPPYVRPVDSTNPKYFEFLENNSHIIYPVLALLAAGLVAWGILSALRTQSVGRVEKAQIKAEIIVELRRNVFGMTTSQLAEHLGVSAAKALLVLEEMKEDRVLETTPGSKETTWRMKGLR